MRIDVAGEFLLPVKHGKRIARKAGIGTATTVFVATLSSNASAYVVPTRTIQGTGGSAQLVAHPVSTPSVVLSPRQDSQRVANTFSKARARIERVARLASGWDGAGSEGPSPVSHAAAREIVALFEQESAGFMIDREPQVVPRPSGGFQFEWHHNTRELHVGFDDGGSLEILEVAPGREEEILGGLERLTEAIRWLLEG
ncbi:MAG: hypothetical protein JNK64_07520 [Myxococcales bacterium]|nr:hypothetical protein [Myxococcales bacterium]